MTISSIPNGFVFINLYFVLLYIISFGFSPYYFVILKAAIEEALDVIEAASTGSLGEVCVNSVGFKSLPVGVALDSRRYDTARQKTDMTAMVLQNLGAAEAMRRSGELEPSCMKKDRFWIRKRENVCIL